MNNTATLQHSITPTLPLVPARVNPLKIHPDERRQALDSGWGFRLDPGDKGIHQKWFQDRGAGWDPILVPGCWQGQGFGDNTPDELWDFRLKARVFRATYAGTGWYRNIFAVPATLSAGRLWLCFGGAHPSADVWVNGVPLGTHGLPFVPFGFEITDLVRRGEPNQLAVRVHEANREYGFAFSWQGNWSGLYRSVDLVATGAQGLEQPWFHPDADRRVLGVNARVGGLPARRPLTLEIRIREAGRPEIFAETTHAVAEGAVRFEMRIPEPKRWSPDAPNLYEVDGRLLAGDQVLDAQTERIGFVRLAARGRQFLINGEPYYMRGSGDFVSCPETGCPDTDRDRWRRKLKTLREYGYNYVRCQSYVYGPEYYDAADEVGLLIQGEMGLLGAWGGNTNWHVYQWPKPTPDHYPSLKRQWDAVVLRDANHPSANLYCMSNELNGDTDFPKIAWEGYRDTRAIKPSAFVIWTDGGYNPGLPGDFVNHNTESFKPDVLAKLDKPLIEHEFRWWSSFPDIRLAARYEAGAVRPYAAEIARAAARAHGQEQLLATYAENSQRLQFIEAKAKMEACRRDNAHLAGICHFNAMDANPSPQGIVDEFYERKLATAETWLQTNGDIVLLSSLNFDNRVLVGGETFACRLWVSDFSHPPLKTGRLQWRLRIGAQEKAAGALDWAHTPFTTCLAGEVRFTVPESAHPVQAMLEAWIEENGRRVRNEWALWIMPKIEQWPAAAGVYSGSPRTGWLKSLPNDCRPADGATPVWLTELVDEKVIAHVRGGGWAIVVATEGLVRPHAPNFGYVKYFFTPPANYGPYEDGQNGTVIADHPLLGNLPHAGFADWQFFRMIDSAPPLDLEPLGLADADPVIRVIHRYPVCRSLGYLVERSHGKGGFIFTALNLDWTLPEARYLLNAMIQRARSHADPAAITPLGESSLKRLAAATALSGAVMGQ